MTSPESNAPSSGLAPCPKCGYMLYADETNCPGCVENEALKAQKATLPARDMFSAPEPVAPAWWKHPGILVLAFCVSFVVFYLLVSMLMPMLMKLP